MLSNPNPNPNSKLGFFSQMKQGVRSFRNVISGEQRRKMAAEEEVREQARKVAEADRKRQEAIKYEEAQLAKGLKKFKKRKLAESTSNQQYASSGSYLEDDFGTDDEIAAELEHERMFHKFLALEIKGDNRTEDEDKLYTDLFNNHHMQAYVNNRVDEPKHKKMVERFKYLKGLEADKMTDEEKAEYTHLQDLHMHKYGGGRRRSKTKRSKKSARKSKRKTRR